MEKSTTNNLKLGIFIIAGLLILVISLYMVGQNQNFFGSNFLLKARFHNVNGLMRGNNVRFSGIQCGTVKDIQIVNDTMIEVSMLVSEKTSSYIRNNAHVAIGTEGLMGNKVINIIPGTADAPAIEDGGTLHTNAEPGLNEIMGTLSTTGDNAMVISSNLMRIAERINSSPFLTELLADTTMIRNLHQSLWNFRLASAQIGNAAASARQIIADVQDGKGTAGILLTDPEAARRTSEVIGHIHHISEQTDRLIGVLDSLTKDLRTDLSYGKGAAYILLRDTSVAKSVRNSLESIEHGTASFSEDMEALKHNFLLKGYFKKQGRTRDKQRKD